MKLFPKLLLLICSLIFSFMAAEGVHRLNEVYLYKKRSNRYQNELYHMVDRPYFYRLNSSVNRTNQIPENPGYIWNYSINSSAFRGTELNENAASTKRVLVIGDSYAFGWGVNDNETHPVYLESILSSSNIGPDVEVINAGIPGYNTEFEYELLKDIFDKIQPDYVILGYVVNDGEPQYTVPVDPYYAYRHTHFWLYEHLKEGVNKNIYGDTGPDKPLNVFKLRSSEKFLRGFESWSPKWKASQEALWNMSAFCKEKNTPFFVFILPSFVDPLDSNYPYRLIHESVLDWAKQKMIPVKDLFPMFEGLDHTELIVKGDGHPNARANRMMAGAMAESVLATMPQKHL